MREKHITNSQDLREWLASYSEYCTISINSSGTVTRDAPDENMVSSGGRDERDNYKISSGSRFFFSKLVGGHFFYLFYFLLSKKDFVTSPK